MKRYICMVLILTLFLSGCAGMQEKKDDTVTFYYIRSEYRYGTDSDIIVGEERDYAGSRTSLSYLMAMYLMGPAEEELATPLPAGTRIHQSEIENGIVKLHLSNNADTLSPEEFTLACACLTLTCLDITDAKAVTVICSDRSLTMNRDALTLFDDFSAKEPTEETQ